MEETLEQYNAVAKLTDGRELTITGTYMECAEWASNVIRHNKDCEIRIERIRKEEA